MHVALAPEPAADRPIFRRDLALAEAKMLDDLGYSEVEAAAAIEWIRQYQTATCCPFISEEHRDRIEALLDADPSWADGRWDAECIAIEADAVLA